MVDFQRRHIRLESVSICRIVHIRASIHHRPNRCRRQIAKIDVVRGAILK